MNEGSIINSINDVKKFLKSINLLETINRSRPFTLLSSKFSEKFYQLCQKDNYKELYRTCIENGDYDFLLKDGSFIQFSVSEGNDGIENGVIRYAFYQSPYKIKTYEEFLEEEGMSYDECKEEFREYYEITVDEAQFNHGTCPIRYDYDYSLYRGLEHSISHIHIGYNTEIRIPLRKILLPEKFIFFIIMNVYPNIFKELVKENDKILQSFLTAKSRCNDVNEEYFNDDEKKMLFMN